MQKVEPEAKLVCTKTNKPWIWILYKYHKTHNSNKYSFTL